MHFPSKSSLWDCATFSWRRLTSLNMFWYQAWLETRSKFRACLATLTLFSGDLVHHAQTLLRPEWKSDFQPSTVCHSTILGDHLDSGRCPLGYGSSFAKRPMEPFLDPLL